ncbi:MAG TPA: class I SAM-dependent methyltransferase [Terriglobales bacterium]|nr:class I SAM-dependent methyltransferase [Terriglobales bacterium]
MLPRIARSYKNLPTAEVFRRIYAGRAWGADEEQGFNSGTGSRGTIAEQYCDWVTNFIRQNGFRTVADLGCGDFYIGSRIIQRAGINYIGVDIVPELIEHHRATFARLGTTFQCLDITRDALPSADVCLIRQVFQHLSNAQILAALKNIGHYPYALISEHVLSQPRSPNVDKSHGPHIRTSYGSGLYLDQPPFSCPVLREWEISVDSESVIRTSLIAERWRRVDGVSC